MKDFKENFNLKDWKVHVLCLVIMVIAELIGTMKIAINGARGNGISFSLIPMLFAIMQEAQERDHGNGIRLYRDLRHVSHCQTQLLYRAVLG